MNNHNQSDTGINIELYHRYDGDLSQMRYDDECKRIEDGVTLYTGGNDVDIDDLTPQVVHNSSNYAKVRKWIRDNYYCYESNYDYGDIWQAFDDELSELADWWDEDGDWWQLVNELKLDTKALEYRVRESRGYSQGDYCQVIIPTNLDYNPDNQDIDHLLWDSPYSGTLMVNDNEYRLDEGMNSIYEVGEDEVLEAIKIIAKELPANESEILLTWANDQDLTPSYE